MYGLLFMTPLKVQDLMVVDFKDDGKVLAFMLQVSSDHLGTDPRFAGFTCKRDGAISKEEHEKGHPTPCFHKKKDIKEPVCIIIDASGLSESDRDAIRKTA